MKPAKSPTGSVCLEKQILEQKNTATSDMTADDAKNIMNLALRGLIGLDFGPAVARSKAVTSPLF
jgi:hypothetical protein